MLDKIRFVAHMYKVVFVALFSVLLGNVEENKNLNIKSSIVSEEEAEQKVSVAFKKNMGAELEELKESVSAVDGGGKISSEKDEKELEEESKPIPAMENIINDPVLPLRSRTQEKNDDAPEKPASIDIPQRAEPIPAIPALNALEKPADIDIPQGAEPIPAMDALEKPASIDILQRAEPIPAIPAMDALEKPADIDIPQRAEPIPTMENIINNSVLPLRSRTQEKNDDAPEKPADIDIPQGTEESKDKPISDSEDSEGPKSDSENVSEKKPDAPANLEL